MKPLHTLLILILFASMSAFSQNIAINDDGSAPDNSDQLDIKSTIRGLLMPRMTAAQRTAISSPVNGLVVYQTDGNAGFYYYNSSLWVPIKDSINAVWITSGNDVFDTRGNVGRSN